MLDRGERKAQGLRSPTWKKIFVHSAGTEGVLTPHSPHVQDMEAMLLQLPCVVLHQDGCRRFP